MGYIQIGSTFINEAAKDQYGPNTYTTNTDGHAYGWKAIVDGQQKSINIHAYAGKKYGTDWRVCLTDMGLYGWNFFNPYQHDFTVCPVMFVPSNFYKQIDFVREAGNTFRQNIAHSQAFFKKALGKTFTLLDRVQMVITNESSGYFEELSYRSLIKEHRFDYLNESRLKYENSIKRINPDIIYVATAYCGIRPDLGDGAAAVSRFVMLPPNNCVLKVNPDKYDLVNYAISHETGHGLGLSHPAQDVPERKTYLMGGGVPPNAKFLDYEIEKLKASQFLG